jgi:hypothetical protein
VRLSATAFSAGFGDGQIDLPRNERVLSFELSAQFKTQNLKFET